MSTVLDKLGAAKKPNELAPDDCPHCFAAGGLLTAAGTIVVCPLCAGRRKVTTDELNAWHKQHSAQADAAAAVACLPLAVETESVSAPASAPPAAAAPPAASTPQPSAPV